MQIHLTEMQFRRLLDMAYIGNWVLNSTRDNDRIREFDEVEDLLFKYCKDHGMQQLSNEVDGVAYPSRAFVEGGIHEAIMEYEDTVFFEILAEEFARRDMEDEGKNPEGEELKERISDYINEFEMHGTDNIRIDR